ncbi:hypothetical protein [Bradyrhizobium sp. CSS354]|uniref:hypothetical protein n=1 Tax=Bradyrhizobium sp. CSS354 TaxID=2699172 RepID=UPI0023B1F08F|nr:hypothetical protein [Bradyrhizobium sp. CSS354]MDE5460195.1 hypothetical protein [Bradyrhizobium sp. CSS354]
MQNEITVVDRYTGKTLHLPRTHAMDRIQQGTAVETVPADVSAAEEWRDDLRARIFAETVERGNEQDIAPFQEFERWCATQGLHALPVKVECVTLFLLSLMRDGAPKHELSPRAYGIERIHALANHPPRQLAKQVLNSVFRALEFAKLEIGSLMGLVEDRELQAARTALGLFPNGEIPKQYTAHV